MDEEQRKRKTVGGAAGVKLRKTLGHILKDEVGSGGATCPESPFISEDATSKLRCFPSKMPSENVGPRKTLLEESTNRLSECWVLTESSSYNEVGATAGEKAADNIYSGVDQENI